MGEVGGLISNFPKSQIFDLAFLFIYGPIGREERDKPSEFSFPFPDSSSLATVHLPQACILLEIAAAVYFSCY